MSKNKLYFDKYLVVTKNGEVGDLLLKMYSTPINGYLYISNIPNYESDTTAFEEHEVEIIEKELFSKLNVDK